MESVLSKFSYLPKPGTLTVCETDGRFVYADEDDESQLNGTTIKEVVPSEFLIDVPLINGDVSTSFTLPYTNESAFNPPPDNQLKNAWLTWRDKGTFELLESLGTETDESSKINKTVSCMLKCFKHCHSIYCTVTLQPKQIEHTEILEGFATVPKWSDSIIRAISVHPHLSMIAIGRKDNVIEIRDTTIDTQQVLPVLLKDRSQVAISCIQWACHSNTLLAVGVLGGVLLWYIDTRHPNVRHPCTFLPCFHSCPVVTMKWCPKGRLLACGTPTDSTLLIWDVPLMSSTKLKRVHGGGISLLSWSPSGDWLFSAHVESLCRVWETTQWTCDKWTNLAGRCKACCWSPGGRYLLFTMEEDSSLYYMAFNGPHMTLGGNGVSAAVKCADLSECCLGDDDSDPASWVGGRVQSLSWDKSGKRLAVLFHSSNIGGSKVAVFHTQCSPVLELFPGGFIQGKAGDVPIWVEFGDCFSNPTVLVTGWDSGRVSFTPMCYLSSTSQLPEKIGSLFHHAPPTSTLLPTTTFGPPTSSLYTKLL